LKVTPVPLTATVVLSRSKLVPVRVTGTVMPCTPDVGLIKESVGGPALTVNPTEPLVPAEVDTVTPCPPVAAFAATANVASAVPGPVTVVEIVIPAPAKVVVLPYSKLL